MEELKHRHEQGALGLGGLGDRAAQIKEGRANRARPLRLRLRYGSLVRS
jgi:hypothetical protein